MTSTLKRIKFLMLVSLMGCRVDPGLSSNVESFSSNKDSNHNIALIVGASNKSVKTSQNAKLRKMYLTGVEADLVGMSQTMKSYGFNTATVDEADASEILSRTKNAAVAVGNDGTFFWYFSGHGSKNGTMLTSHLATYYNALERIRSGEDSDQLKAKVAEHRKQTVLAFSDVLDTIIAARNGVPIKRAIILIDSCFSGKALETVSEPSLLQIERSLIGTAKFVGPLQNMTFTKSLIEDFKQEIFDLAQKVNRRNFAEEWMIAASSQPNETSQDLPTGGAFSTTFRNIMNWASNQNVAPTFSRLEELVREYTKKNGNQMPRIRYSSPEFAQQTIR